MSPRTLLVTDYTFPSLEHEQEAARETGLRLDARQLRTEAEVAEAAGTALAVLVQFAPFGEAACAALPGPGVIVRYGVGYDNIDVEAARRFGHRVCYVPDYCTAEVADHTVAMLLSVLRKIPQLDTSVRRGEWKAVATMAPASAFGSQTLGFLGFGRIGQEVWRRLKAFGFSALVHDPGIGDRVIKASGARPSSLGDVRSSADVILVHLPSTDATRSLVDHEFLRGCKPGASLVNASRGDVLVENAVSDALVSGQLGAAALDVFVREPLPSQSPLRTTPNTILSPHAAWYSETSIQRLQQLAADEVRRFFRNQPARCPVSTGDDATAPPP